MVTDEQVKLFRKKRMEGKNQEQAAAAAGLAVRTARRWESGPLPSETKKARSWRTRPDPFAEVWESEVVPLLERDRQEQEQSGRSTVLQAKTVLGELRRRHPGQFPKKQLRSEPSAKPGGGRKRGPIGPGDGWAMRRGLRRRQRA